MHEEDEDETRDMTLREEEERLDVQVAYCSNCEELALKATDSETWLAHSYFSH